MQFVFQGLIDMNQYKLLGTQEPISHYLNEQVSAHFNAYISIERPPWIIRNHMLEFGVNPEPYATIHNRESLWDEKFFFACHP